MLSSYSDMLTLFYRAKHYPDRAPGCILNPLAQLMTSELSVELRQQTPGHLLRLCDISAAKQIGVIQQMEEIIETAPQGITTIKRKVFTVGVEKPQARVAEQFHHR
jgi:hypothetical protein